MSVDYLSGPVPLLYYVSETASTNTSSSSDSAMASMNATPPAGVYLAAFNSDIKSNNAGAAISVSFYIAGSQQATSLRKIIPFDGGALSATAARGIMHIEDVVTLNGTQTLDVRWSTSGGTATAAARTLTLMRIVKL